MRLYPLMEDFLKTGLSSFKPVAEENPSAVDWIDLTAIAEAPATMAASMQTFTLLVSSMVRFEDERSCRTRATVGPSNLRFARGKPRTHQGVENPSDPIFHAIFGAWGCAFPQGT